jgi:small GTP-binding protein
MIDIGGSDSKVIFLGDPSVGKTSIIQQYHTHHFTDDADATIGASFVSREIASAHGPVQVRIWDTAGQERYRGLIPMYSRNAMAALLVVDVTNQASYEHVGMWLSLVQTNCAACCQIYIVANKCDLECAIPIAKLEEWAKEHGYPLFRTSAKQYESVAVVFAAVADRLGSAAKVRVAQTMAAPRARTPEKTGCC